LPFTPEPNQIRANFENGVLNVHIPKQDQQERSHRIAIQGSSTDVQEAQNKDSAAQTGQASEVSIKH